MPGKAKTPKGQSRNIGGGQAVDSPAAGCAVRLDSGPLELLCGPPLRQRVFEDLQTAESEILIMTANLKLTRTGRRSDFAGLLIRLAQKGVKLKILISSASGPLLHRLAELGAADLPGLEIRLCPRNHAKLIMLDQNVVYCGSANLTGKGLGPMVSADSMNIELMLRFRAKKELALFGALHHYIWSPAWSASLCEKCLLRKKERCDGQLDKYQILDLG